MRHGLAWRYTLSMYAESIGRSAQRSLPIYDQPDAGAIQPETSGRAWGRSIDGRAEAEAEPWKCKEGVQHREKV